jgi:hypothetical protein
LRGGWIRGGRGGGIRGGGGAVEATGQTVRCECGGWKV